MNTHQAVIFVVGIPPLRLLAENFTEYQIEYFDSLHWAAIGHLPQPDIWLVDWHLLDYMPDLPQQNVVAFCTAAQENEALGREYLTDVVCYEHLNIRRLSFILKKNLGKKMKPTAYLVEKDWLGMVAQNTSDIVLILSPDDAVLYISPSVQKVLGYTPEEITEKRAWDFVHADDAQKIYEQFAAGFWENNNIYVSELRCRTKDNRWICMEALGGKLSEQTNLQGFIFNLRDVTARKQAEKQLTHHSHILSQINEAIIGTNASGQISYLNNAAEKLYQTKISQIWGKDINLLFDFEWVSPEQEEDFIQKSKQNMYWQGELVHISNITGEHLFVDMSHHIIYYSDGTLEKLLVVRDISESKSKDFNLLVSELRFRNLVESISDLVWRTDTQSTFTYISPAVEHVLGYSPEEIIGKSTAELMPKVHLEHTLAYFQRVKEKKESFSFYQLQLFAKDGRMVVLEMSGTPLFNYKNEWIGYQGIMQDITHRISSENQLSRSLREKETLIKEIHHRVKNNMQIISSLLFLQAQKIKDKAILDLYDDSQRRIKSMALVHEKLYQSPDLSRIEFNGYVQSLVSMLASSHRSSHVELMAIPSENPSYLDIETAIPCGLIINELVLNCYKYAFPDGRRGKICVAFNQDKITGLYQLKIYDDGIGLPEKVMETSTLGMPLVKGLAGQINANFSSYTDNGAVFVITFSDQVSREMPTKE